MAQRQHFTALPPIALLYTSPAKMLGEIERTGRFVTVPLELFQPQFNRPDNSEALVVLTTPAMCGLSGGSYRKIDAAIRERFGFRTISRFIACNVARTLPHGPQDLDIVVAMDFVTGADGKTYLFVISNRRGPADILDGVLAMPRFAAVYFDKPGEAPEDDKKRDFIAHDQHLLYLPPL